MPPESTSGTGQVPPTSQSPDGNGQVPPTSQDATTATSDVNAPSSRANWTTDQYEEALVKARKDDAQRRVDAKRLAELEAKEAAAAEAELSEKQRYEKKIQALEAQVAEERKKREESNIFAEIRSLADRQGIDPKLANKLIERGDVTLDESGQPTNMADLFKAMLEEYPQLTPAQQQQQLASASNPVPQLGATNPSRNGRGQAALAANDPSQTARFGQGRNLFKNQ